MTNYKIYMIKFPNSKVYIGLTKNSIQKRMSSHTSCKDDRLVNRALKKYRGRYTVHIIENGIQTLEEASRLEVEYIKEYNSYEGTGYNLCIGGSSNKGYKHTQKAKDTISQKKRGWNPSKETRDRMSQSAMGRTSPNKGKFGEQAPMYGKTHSEETRARMSQSAQSRCKYFDVFTLDEEFVGTYLNRALFERDNNLYRGAVTQVLSGKSKFAGKFKFKYTNREN